MSLKKVLLVLAIAVFSFILGYDRALTRLADDMHFGRTSLRDNRLVLEIRCRRILYKNYCAQK